MMTYNDDFEVKYEDILHCLQINVFYDFDLNGCINNLSSSCFISTYDVFIKMMYFERADKSVSIFYTFRTIYKYTV